VRGRGLSVLFNEDEVKHAGKHAGQKQQQLQSKNTHKEKRLAARE